MEGLTSPNARVQARRDPDDALTSDRLNPRSALIHSCDNLASSGIMRSLIQSPGCRGNGLATRTQDQGPRAKKMTGLDLESFLLLLRADLSAWLMLGLASLGLALLVWVCWGSRRALRKCLVLSVAAHLGIVLFGSTVPAVQLAIRGESHESADRIAYSPDPGRAAGRNRRIDRKVERRRRANGAPSTGTAWVWASRASAGVAGGTAPAGGRRDPRPSTEDRGTNQLLTRNRSLRHRSR